MNNLQTLRRTILGGVVLTALLLTVASLLGSCRPATPKAIDSGISMFNVTATVAGDTIRVRHDWRPGPDDGAGNPDFWIITTGTNAGTPKVLKDSVNVAFAIRTYTVTWAGNPPGTYTGFGCGKALRRGTPSTTANCRQWTAVVVDAPPPPPIYDSLSAKVAMLDTVGLEATLAVRQITPGFTVTRRLAETNRDTQGVDVIYLDAASTAIPTTARNLSLCLVKVLPGRKVGQRTGSSDRCKTAFQSYFPAEYRTLSTAEQASVDSAIGEQIWEVPPTWKIHFVKQGRDSLAVNPILEAQARQAAAIWLAMAE